MISKYLKLEVGEGVGDAERFKTVMTLGAIPRLRHG